VTVRTVRELLASPDLDWSQLGMVLHALEIRSATHEHRPPARPG
jgi:hypothetical protein